MKRYRELNSFAFTIFHNSVYTFFIKSVLILSTVVLTIPVLQGCGIKAHPLDSDFTEEKDISSVKLAVLKSEEEQIRSLDAFVFNNDQLNRIDCYQRIDGFSGAEVLIGSGTGRKLILLCANAPWEKIRWADVYSLHKASALKVDLEQEDSRWPVMTDLTDIEAGGDGHAVLERLTGEVELRSIRCDFTGKPYDGESITDAIAYLTNVNGTCSIVPSEYPVMERIINHRGLIPDDIQCFKDPEIILDSIGVICFMRSCPGIRLLCYPNTFQEESISTPFTRLVIEGKIQGDTWYWPININRGAGNDHEGVERNHRYVYDLTIRSKGTKDPDIAITHEMAETEFITEKWEEKESYHVSF